LLKQEEEERKRIKKEADLANLEAIQKIKREEYAQQAAEIKKKK